MRQRSRFSHRAGSGLVLLTVMALTGLAPVAGQAAQSPPPSGEPVTVTGTAPDGTPLTATGTRTPDGVIVLYDTTTGDYDPATGRGAIRTHDMSGLQESGLPGPLATFSSPQVADSPALAAHAYGRYIYDYYTQVFGRRSYDGQSAPLVSSVHLEQTGGVCYAFFSTVLDPPQMVFPDCTEGGQTFPFVDIDTAGHEVTHGITATTANLLYTGQSGALNESFSDYFGNVMGDAFLGIAVETGGRDTSGIQTSRLLNGSSFRDYLYLLDPPLATRYLGIRQDNGGVHLNSAVWNNVMWSIRTRLAQIDGVAAKESVLARTFDAVVFDALTRYLTPTSGFLDARAAIEEAARARGVDAVISDVIREVMDLNSICAGCAGATAGSGLPLVTTTATQKSPTVSGDHTGWLEFVDSEDFGQFVWGADGQRQSVAAVVGGALVGDASITFEPPPDFTSADVVLRSPQGQARVLTTATRSFSPLIAGSDELGAFIVDGQMYAITAAGQLHTAPATGSSGEPAALGVGGGTVALGTDAGEIVTWTPGSAPQVLSAGGPVVEIDAYGQLVAAVVLANASASPDHGRLVLIDTASGNTTELSDAAAPFGLDMNDRYLAWAQVTGTHQGRLAGGLSEAATALGDVVVGETDIYLYSSGTGVTYAAVAEPGQQGFPVLSGDSLTWVHAGEGGDDIWRGYLPPGL